MSQRKLKNAKDSEKKFGKKTDALSPSTPIESKPHSELELPVENTSPLESIEVEIEPVIEIKKPEPVYEEPVLTKLIVTSYVGDIVKAKYDGFGECQFLSGDSYSGEFREGKMHGQGVYTWLDGTVYEGDVTNNTITGKGIYRWPDGSSYDGEVFKSKRHGLGCYRCPKHIMSYTGDWDGRLEYDSDGQSFYEGSWVENEKHGFGSRRYLSGNVYEGNWYKNHRHGDGTMHWYNENQMYVGQWEYGIQNGVGQHIWFLRRVPGSQYPLRNMYDGEFVNGLRHGNGTFHYANGARYEGQWDTNLKHGKGKFVFKNGRVYEGLFERDHIAEFPSFSMDGLATPDMSLIRTRTPLASEQMTLQSNASVNTIGPSFQLEVDAVLDQFADDKQEEAMQVTHVVMRHMTTLRHIYTYYASMGMEPSVDNTFVLTRLQFWRLLKDCKMHEGSLTLTDVDRIIGRISGKVEDQHNPFIKILFREFVNYLIILAYYKYVEERGENTPILAWCTQRLIDYNLLSFSCEPRGQKLLPRLFNHYALGFIYNERRRSMNVLVHLERAYEVYQFFTEDLRKEERHKGLKMREFLFILGDLKLLNNDLTAKGVVDVLAKDDVTVRDSEDTINMELEMTFLEFFEALVGCAELFVTEAVVKDPTTPQPGSSLTQEQSLYSTSGSPSRIASQVDGDDVDAAASEKDVNMQRSVSEVTHASNRIVEVSEENIASRIGTSERNVAQSQKSQLDSGKKSDMSIMAKKSASFFSETAPALVQSLASVGALQDSTTQADEAEEENGEEQEMEEEDLDNFPEEEVDEDTRRFNFWTYQVHIFFVRKFFPAAQKFRILKNMMDERERIKEQALIQASIVRSPTPDHHYY